eukprot:gene8153-7509_t
MPARVEPVDLPCPDCNPTAIGQPGVPLRRYPQAAMRSP